jgi:hypothetical protein
MYPQKLPLIKNINCNDIIAKTLTDRKSNTKRYRVDIAQTDNQWKATYFKPGPRDYLLINPTLGATIIGSSWSPSIGASLYTMFGNKYGTPKFKLGVLPSFYVLTDYSNLQFRNAYLIGDVEGRFLWNTTQLSHPEKPVWFGISAGYLNGYGKGDLDKSLKAGLAFQYKGMDYSFNFIKSKNPDKSVIYGLSVKFLF